MAGSAYDTALGDLCQKATIDALIAYLFAFVNELPDDDGKNQVVKAIQVRFMNPMHNRVGAAGEDESGEGEEELSDEEEENDDDEYKPGADGEDGEQDDNADGEGGSGGGGDDNGDDGGDDNGDDGGDDDGDDDGTRKTAAAMKKMLQVARRNTRLPPHVSPTQTSSEVVDYATQTLRSMNLGDTATQALLSMTVALLDLSKLPRVMATLRELRQSMAVTNAKPLLDFAQHRSAALHNVMLAFSTLHTTRQRTHIGTFVLFDAYVDLASRFEQWVRLIEEGNAETVKGVQRARQTLGLTGHHSGAAGTDAYILIAESVVRSRAAAKAVGGGPLTADALRADVRNSVKIGRNLAVLQSCFSRGSWIINFNHTLEAKLKKVDPRDMEGFFSAIATTYPALGNAHRSLWDLCVNPITNGEQPGARLLFETVQYPVLTNPRARLNHNLLEMFAPRAEASSRQGGRSGEDEEMPDADAAGVADGENDGGVDGGDGGGDDADVVPHE